ncbi:MAG: hypothetical protein WCT29_02880 [Candidatus Paceibacterota bacterium]|jgi:hypothetical protein
MAGNKKFIKLISVILIIAVFMPSVAILSTPKRAEAQAAVAEVGPWAWISKALMSMGISQETITALIKGKEWAWKITEELAKAAAMKALQEMTKSTITWINQGYHGTPLFLENPQSFFQDIVKYEVKTAVDAYGYNELMYPFGRDFALNTINAYKSQIAENNAYTLSSVINDPILLKNYQTDFNVGGWTGFLINTQYPQNNYIGFQMTATEDLARKIQTPVNNKLAEVQNTVSQGMGFLSPQMCQTNPSYNNDFYNQFNAPKYNESKFDKTYLETHPYPETGGVPTPEDENAVKTWELNRDLAMAEDRGEWGKTNECPPNGDGSSGLVNTTPGAVVANQIFQSVQTPTTLKQMAVNSGTQILSAVFDQLIGKLVDAGLNALASKTNPPPPQGEEWSYNGIKLGGSATVSGYNNGDDIWSTPDEIVTVADFKTKVEAEIKKTETEIKYMSNNVPDSFGPGTMQVLAQLWPKAQTLDICQPGPDINWGNRFDSEMTINQTKFSGDSPEAASNSKELEYAASIFKDWVSTQTKYALPSSASYLGAIDDLPDLDQQATQVQNKLDEKSDVLTQLKLMKTKLETMTGEPAAGSEEERTLLSLWSQRKAILGQISNDISLGETSSERDIVLSKSQNLDQLLIRCKEERVAKGWDAQGGPGSKQSAGAVTEQVYFCEAPIVGGFSHKTFINTGTIAYPQIPLVNASNVANGGSSVDVTMNCGNIFSASILDYKGNLPSF